MITLDIASHTTPLGRVEIALRGGLLCTLSLEDAFPPFGWQLERRFPVCAKRTRSDAAARVKRALDAYFAGELGGLAELPIDLGGSDFQRAVWSALRAVPAGETVGYGALARAIGRPQAARAVGAACGANPVWLVVPCHRAIGSDGHLVGYAAGLERKGWLLAHERARKRSAQRAEGERSSLRPAEGERSSLRPAEGERSSREPALRDRLGFEIDARAHAGDARAS